MHNTCTGIPDVKNPQCYNCKELSVCVLLNNNLKAIEQMLSSTQQKVDAFCQNVVINMNKLAEQQNSTSIQLVDLINKSNTYINELPKYSAPESKQDYSETNKGTYEVQNYNEEIIDVDIKKSLLEKGKEMFGLIKT